MIAWRIGGYIPLKLLILTLYLSGGKIKVCKNALHSNEKLVEL